MRSMWRFALAGLVLVAAWGVSWGDGIIIPEPTPDMPRPVPLSVKYHHVTVEIKDNVATTKIDQVFLNESGTRLEGTYVFPLPEGAAIGEFAMYIEGERVSGEIMEASKAREIYEDIVRKMRDPALLEYIGRNTFRARVFPIEPHSEKRVQLEYVQTLDFAGGAYEYTYPLNTEKFSPRPLQEASVAVTIESRQAIKSVYCPTHEIDKHISDMHHASASWEASNVKPDRDFTLLYTVGEEDFGVALRCFRRAGEAGYFMLLVAPKAELAETEIAAKDLVLVLDKSGSMSGEKIEQAKNALTFALQNLDQRDRFGVVSFSSEADSFTKDLQKATRERVQKATAYARDIDAAGGTNLLEALQAALHMLGDNEQRRPQMVVLLTDGIPTVGETDYETIVRQVERQNHVEGRLRSRLFVFGVGYDVNTVLLDKMAAENGGLTQYVAPEENLETAVSEFHGKVSHPVLTDLSLDFGEAEVQAVHPKPLPDLFKGSTVTVFGRYRGQGESAVLLRGQISGQEREYRYEVNFPRREKKNEFIPLLWAQRRVGALLEEIRLHGESKELKEEIVQLALRYGIVTPYTSYLVLEEAERLRAAGQPVPVPYLDRGPAGPWAPTTVPREHWAGGYAAGVGAPAARASTEIQALKIAAVPQGLPGPAGTYVRQVGDRAFYLRDSVWYDSAHTEGMEMIEIRYGSEAYFELLSLNPDLGQYLALGENVRVVVDGLCVAISQQAGAEALTQEHRERLERVGETVSQSGRLEAQVSQRKGTFGMTIAGLVALAGVLGLLRSRRIGLAALVVLALAGGTFSAQAQPAVSGESQGVEITVYNQNLGLVKDRRTISLSEGLNNVPFEDVAALIDPTSVHFKSLSHPEETRVVEQNYQFDLVNQDRLLQKYLDKEIVLVRYDENGREIERRAGTLLSQQGGQPAVVRFGDQIVVNPPGVVVLPKLPEGLITKPTLVWTIETGKAGPHLAEVSYLTEGLNWHCEYVAVVDNKDERMDVNGWVTLVNSSGATYKEARLKLVAGAVHRVEERPRVMYAEGEVMAARARAEFVEEAFFEYHLYTLERPTTVRDNEQKQVLLLSAAGVPVVKKFVYDPERPRYWMGGGDPSKQVQVILEFKNSQENQMGMPLPAGKVRVYKADQSGSLQFAGEDAINHTPKDEKVELYLGNAFDLVGEIKHTDHRQPAPNLVQDSYEVRLRNHKQEPVVIRYVHHLYGEWEVLEKTQEWTKKDAYTIEFPVEVGAGAEEVVRFRVQVKQG